MRQTTPRINQPRTAKPRVPYGFNCKIPPQWKVAASAGSLRGLKPPQARAEFFTRRPPPPPHLRGDGPWRGSALAAAGLLAAGVIMLSLWHQPAPPASSVARSVQSAPPLPASSPEARATPATTPATGWNADGTGFGRAGTLPEVRRALPVVHRAQLVHVRPIGTYENDLMPDGRVLTTRYMGELSSAAGLPAHGSQLGDMWFTRNDSHCWVLAPIGAGSTTVGWIDP